MTIVSEESKVDQLIREQYERDVDPGRLPVQHATWMRLPRIGVDVDKARGLAFIDDGTDVSMQMRQLMGWWVFVVEGWPSYIEWRDVQISEMQGEGRPWIHRLPWLVRMQIFREFILLVNAWNRCSNEGGRVVPRDGVVLPEWLERWLSLTNESFERGLGILERAAWDAIADRYDRYSAEAAIEILKDQYAKSRGTWRAAMPERAVFHRAYGDRKEYWSFER